MGLKNLFTSKLKKQFLAPKSEENAFYSKDIYKDKKYQIGDFTYGKFTILFENEDANLSIGKFCSIAEGVTIFLGGNHRVDWFTTYPFNILDHEFPTDNQIKGHPATKGNVTIGNDVWIGKDVMILSGVTIADGAVLAARSVVTKNVGPYEIWGGNPAKLIRKRFDDETIIKLLESKWWDMSKEEIIKKLAILCGDNKRIDEL